MSTSKKTIYTLAFFWAPLCLWLAPATRAETSLKEDLLKYYRTAAHLPSSGKALEECQQKGDVFAAALEIIREEETKKERGENRGDHLLGNALFLLRVLWKQGDKRVRDVMLPYLKRPATVPDPEQGMRFEVGWIEAVDFVWESHDEEGAALVKTILEDTSINPEIRNYALQELRMTKQGPSWLPFLKGLQLSQEQKEAIRLDKNILAYEKVSLKKKEEPIPGLPPRPNVGPEKNTGEATSPESAVAPAMQIPPADRPGAGGDANAGSPGHPSPASWPRIAIAVVVVLGLAACVVYTLYRRSSSPRP